MVNYEQSNQIKWVGRSSPKTIHLSHFNESHPAAGASHTGASLRVGVHLLSQIKLMRKFVN